MITFIVPTIGRDTLSRTLTSLKNQTIKEWKAIVIFDGIKSNIEEDDERIKIIEIEKSGLDVNSAGNVRNKGIKHADTEWLAFVDDDDMLHEKYIECFNEEITRKKTLDVVIFRMFNDNNHIVPLLNTDNFYVYFVGISFAVKKSIFDKGIVFIPSYKEDFDYLDKLRTKGYKMCISPYTTYFVRRTIVPLPLGNRLYIN